MLCFVVLSIFLHVDVTYTSADCDSIHECAKCVRHESWWDNCRWCPIDRKCHGTGSGVIPGFGDDVCTGNQDITSAGRCPQDPPPVTSQYDKYLAYELLMLSTAAYYDEPDKCMEQLGKDFVASGMKKYEFKAVFKQKCDDYLFDYEECYVVLALSHQRKLITISYRGTTNAKQLLDEVLTVLATSKVKLGKGHVQQYFLNAYQQLQRCLEANILEMIQEHPDYKVAVSGHSLGGAIASIAAFQLVKRNIVPANKLVLYTYGMPRVGDKDYALEFDGMFSNSWRVVHYMDCITHFPTCSGSCTTSAADSPFHHRYEVYYVGHVMRVDTDPRICEQNEDDSCSHREQGPVDTPKTIASGDCFKDHLSYFDIPVGTYCEEKLGRRRKRSPINDHLCNNTCCTFVKVNGEWVRKRFAPTVLSSDTSATVTSTDTATGLVNSGQTTFPYLWNLILACTVHHNFVA